MILDRMTYLDYNKFNNINLKFDVEKKNNIIIDNNNSNIFYFLSVNGDFYKINLGDNTFNSININKLNKPYFTTNIICQDDDFIYYSYTYMANSSHNYFYIYKINKFTLNIDTIYGDNGFNQSSVYIEKGSYIDEINCYYCKAGRVFKTVIDLKTHLFITFQSEMYIAYDLWENYMSILNSTKNEDFIYFAIKNKSNHNIQIYKYSKKNNIINEMEFLNNIINIKYPNVFKNLTVFNIKKNNKDYLVLIVTLPNYYNKNYNEIAYSHDLKCYLLEVQDTKLKVINTYDLSHLGTTNVIYQKDTELFILGSFRNINLLRIDDNLEFNNIFNIYGKYSAYGIGRDNNIYIQYEDSSIFRLDKGTDVFINVKFEKEIYQFTGNFIESFIKVDILNLYGEHLKKDINLELIGDAEFLDGSKVKNITTSNLGSTEIPIIVKGSSKLEYIIKII